MFFTNAPTSSSDHFGVFLTDISDHLPTFFNTQMYSKIDKKTVSYTRNYCLDNINKFHTALQNVDWSDSLYCNDVNKAYDSFISLFGNTYQSCFPYKKTKLFSNRMKQPWITPGVLKSIKTKNKLYKRRIKSPSN